MTTWRTVAEAVLSALVAPPCAVCLTVLEHPLRGAVCDRCWRSIGRGVPPFRGSGSIAAASAIGEYAGSLREIVHALKYQGRRSVAPRLAALMRSAGEEVLAGAHVVVPVPLHPRKERERGFNQADELARGLGLPVAHVLRRVHPTRPQVELPASARHHNVQNAFVCAYDRTLVGKICVLIDDVMTTGATAEACARVMVEAGVGEVRALTAARVASALR